MASGQQLWTPAIHSSERMTHSPAMKLCLPASPEFVAVKTEPGCEQVSATLQCAVCEYRSASSGEMAAHRKRHVQLATRERCAGKPEAVAAAANLPEVNAYYMAAAAMSKSNPGSVCFQPDIEIGNSFSQKKRVYTPVREAVDPGKYMIIHEIDGTKYACTQCGNIYKWRKSLNKHWKEKHGALKPASTPASSLLFPSRVTPANGAPSTKTSPLPGTLPSTSAATSYFLAMRCPRAGSLDFAGNGPRLRAPISPEIGQRNAEQDDDDDDDRPLDLSTPARYAAAGHFSRYEPYSEQPVTAPLATPTDRQRPPRLLPVTPYGHADAASLYRQLAGGSLRAEDATTHAAAALTTPPWTRDAELAAGGTVIVMPRSPEAERVDEIASPVGGNRNSEVAAASCPTLSAGSTTTLWHNYMSPNQGNKLYRPKQYAKREGVAGVSLAGVGLAGVGAPGVDSRASLPYKCDSCDFRARWPSEINQHRKNHSSVKPYACPRCTYRSKWKWDVVKHLKRCGGGSGSEVSVRDVIDHSGPTPALTGAVVTETLAVVGSPDARKLTGFAATLRSCRKCEFRASDFSEFLLHQKGHAAEPSTTEPGVQLACEVGGGGGDPFEFSDGGSTIPDDCDAEIRDLSHAPSASDVRESSPAAASPRLPDPASGLEFDVGADRTDSGSRYSAVLRRASRQLVLSAGRRLKRYPSRSAASPRARAKAGAAGAASARRTLRCRRCVYVTRVPRLYAAHARCKHAAADARDYEETDAAEDTLMPASDS